MSTPKPSADPVPTVTLRADNPLHMKVLLLAQQGLTRELGARAPETLELSKTTRRFEVFWEGRGGFSVGSASGSGPQFPRF
jgi:hypothetical protein